MSAFTTEAHPQQRSPLFNLAPELRNEIYDYAVTTDIPLFSQETGLIESVYEADPCHTIHLLLTCQRIHQEVNRSSIPEHVTSYCRNTVVKELTSYYEFLQKMYLPENSIVYPPVGSGWEKVTPEYCQGKTPAVMDLLRHIPYVQGWELHVYVFSIVNEYFKGAEGCKKPKDSDCYDFYSLIPDYVVTIADKHEDPGHYIFFDTVRGTFTMAEFSDSGCANTSHGMYLAQVWRLFRSHICGWGPSAWCGCLC